MKSGKQARREAKQLFKSCLIGDKLDENRARQAVALLIERKPRGYIGIVQEFQRLVKLDVASRTASVESAMVLDNAQRQAVQAGLIRLKSGEVAVEFSEDASLIGGMRVKIGDDVYDGSVKTRLAQLGDSF
ncbi:MAG: ATP synthase F1 subunit delta [Verrucomicrobiota bacterium]|nr:ATP synthase F1 subunit delta [Verrucomicrobiota bacterium]